MKYGNEYQVGLSNRPSNPLNPANPHMSDLKPPDSTTPVVGRGFRARQPDPTRVGSQFSISKPVTPELNQTFILSAKYYEFPTRFGKISPLFDEI